MSKFYKFWKKIIKIKLLSDKNILKSYFDKKNIYAQ